MPLIPPPGFMLQMDFVYFNVESIRVCTSTFVVVCYDALHPFGFASINKFPPLDILNFLVAKFRNHYKKVSFIKVDEYGALERSYELMNTCHNMNIIFKNTGGDASSLNGKSEIPNNKLGNITRSLLMNSIHNKEPWCTAYQYAI